MSAGNDVFTQRLGKFVTSSGLLLTSQRRYDVSRWYAAMPQDVDGAITRWRKASIAAGSDSLIMRPANAAKRCRVALPPSRRATAQYGPPDDDQFQVRETATFSRGFWPEGLSRPKLCAPSGEYEATLEGAVAKIMPLIIQIGATLFRIA